MAIIIDPVTKRIILDSVAVTATEIWAAWIAWVALSDNMKYAAAFRQAGGDELGAGIFIPVYMFLQNGWRVRPMEANHQLVITGNLFVEEGGSPTVQTLGNFNVSVQLTVPVQAQAVATGGSDPSSIASAVMGSPVEAGISLRDAMQILTAISAGKTVIVDNGAGNAEIVFRSVNDTVDRVTASMQGSNRVDVEITNT